MLIAISHSLLLRVMTISTVQGLGIAYCYWLLFNMIIAIDYCYCLLLLPSRGRWGGAAPPSSVSFFYTFSKVFGVLCRFHICFQSYSAISRARGRFCICFNIFQEEYLLPGRYLGKGNYYRPVAQALRELDYYPPGASSPLLGKGNYYPPVA